ncbi:MAG TPA: single-stranded-DNA-specific exonuclease RecJ [candidate division Zixibacteria bacterium]|nr:single-stranded-DNA-specific exonuclease RecJ [candidate division Zixibacteria bacterium]MDD4916270.1 single-stranded-DNA-specific exonuclease RecJ [candidate division Zixibacteria bacterium]MDM7973651.1 single-stranded-DNA-specific exonuclease RecJ [candidate division Zixibacteria bacterium]HOD66584.1 single-stranded-DNA-specific exonuclease RecJ [candidate division Zixibacteria bacterium]HOZ07631.1 single-stranded-DNA-specific exonuclease RecJ [candidate division Zixibacteria bacterium]
MNVAHRSKPLKWVVAVEPDPALVEHLAAATGISKNIVKILVNREIRTPEAIDRFLNPKLSDLEDPFTLKGMTEGIERVTRALFQNEKITIYGDYDVDGITATALLYMVLNKLGAQVDFYLPNRLTEGYGLSREGIDESKNNGVSLIITVDTGITAVEEIKYANSIGIDVLVTDHHEPGGDLPAAYTIINPKQIACDYKSELSGVGVAFKFCQALYRALNQDETELWEHLDLVALGTSADIVPLVNENRILTKFGINQISRTTKPGLKSLTFVAGLMGKDISTGQVVFILAPRINALGRLGDAGKAIRLLATRDERAAAEIARKLDSENKRRKEIDETTLEEALAQMDDVCDLEADRAIVLAQNDWHQGVIGIVASRLVERFHLPTVMISIVNGEGKGSARSIPGFHLCEALKECEHLLIRYGGHKYAAGLSIAPDKVEEFRRLFVEVSNRILSEEDITPKMHIDLEIELSDIDDHFMNAIEAFAPFGPQNMRPVFLTRNCEVVGQPYVVGNNHLKMRLRKGDTQFDVIGFGFGDMARMISARGCLVDAVYVVEYNTYNGVTRKQIRLKDLRLTAGTGPVPL